MKPEDLLEKELDIALENRVFELQLFWQRTNYFLVLITALGIGIFSINNNILSSIMSIFATISSFLWLRTNLGSKFWQESWEAEVSNLAEELKIRSFQRGTQEIMAQVKSSLQSQKQSCFRSWIDGLILKKYSVTYHMIILSLFSMVLWSCIGVYFIIESL